MRNYNKPAVAGALCVGIAMLSCLAGLAAAQCVGDCDGNGAVAINELIVGVAIALGNQPSSACPVFQNAQGEVSIAQLIQGVNNALGGCPEDGLLGGPPSGRALDAVRDQFSPDAYVLPEELSGPLVRTQVELAFRKDATVDAVNALLRRIDGRIVSSRAGVAILVVRIPDPGGAAALEQLLAELAADPLVRAANPVLVPDPKVLPATSNSMTGTPFVEFVRQQLAVRAHAAWNAIPALIPAIPPLLVVGDFFGNGPPGDAFGVFAVPGDFGSDAPNDHGYLILGIAAAAFDPESVPFDVDAVAGLYPAGLAVRAVDMSLVGGLTLPLNELDDRMLKLISAAPDRVVLNTSIGTKCKTLEAAADYCSRESATEHALSWIERVRGSDWPDDLSHDLEGKFLHATAASNVESIGRLGADVSSRWNAATLISPLIDPKTLELVPNLTNTLVVENFMSSSDEPFQPDCIAPSSEVGGNIGAIGSPVYGFRSATSAGTLADGGTSSATPQVAALAAYVWALRPGLTPAELVALLQRTASHEGCGNGLVIDAYAAVLAADEGNPTRPVLHAILDVADSSGNEGSNGAFDERDLDLFLMHIDTSGPAPLDYGRYDLNGDGFTGFPGMPGGSKRIDLDLDGDYGLARLDVEGLSLRFDEEGLSDLKVLCYEAYSSVYAAGDPDARTERLGLEACLQADLEVIFPTTVQSDVSELLSVRLVDLDLADPATGDLLGQAGARIELTVTGGTVDDFVGTTDDDGIFQTNARRFSGQPELTIEVVARARENGPELARKTIHASGLPTSCSFPPSSVRLNLTIGNRGGDPNPIQLDTNSPTMLGDSAEGSDFANSATVREGFIDLAARDDNTAAGFDGEPAVALGEFNDQFVVNPIDPSLQGIPANATVSVRVTVASEVSGDRAAAFWSLNAIFPFQELRHIVIRSTVPGQTSGDLEGGTYTVTAPISLGRPIQLDVSLSAGVVLPCGMAGTEPCGRPPSVTGAGHIDATVQWLGITDVRDQAGHPVPFTVCSASGTNWAGPPAATPTSGPTSTSTLTGTPTGTPTPSPTSTSAIGARRFSAHFGGALDETGESIAIDSAGNVLLGGSIQSIVDFGTGPVMPSGGDDAVVVKFDSNGTALWTKVYGDASSQAITDVAFDSLGNVLITGQFAGSIDFGGGPLTSAGGNDIFVAKLDTNGNHLWSKRFGDASTQTGGKIAIDRGNNVLIAGNFEGAVDFGGGPLTSAGGIDICLAKLDLNGNHVFSKRFGSTGDQLCGDLAVDGSDNIYLTGGFSGSVNFGGGILTSAGLNDVYLAKLNVAGTHVFSTRYGNASDQTSSGIAVNSTGVAITGTFDGSIDFGGGPLTSAGSTDVFVAQFSTAGAHIWSGGFGNSGTQQSGGICNDTLGGVWVTGRFGGTIDFGGGVLTSAGAEDVYIAQLTSSGAHSSSQGFGDASSQNGLAVAATVTGDPWITGEFAGTIDFGGGPLTSSGGLDIYLAELNP